MIFIIHMPFHDDNEVLKKRPLLYRTQIITVNKTGISSNTWMTTDRYDSLDTFFINHVAFRNCMNVPYLSVEKTSSK